MEVLHNLRHVISPFSQQAEPLDMCAHLLISSAIMSELPLLHGCKDPEHIAVISAAFTLFEWYVSYGLDEMR